MTTHRISANAANLVADAELGTGETFQNNAEASGCDVKAAGMEPDAIRIGNPRFAPNPPPAVWFMRLLASAFPMSSKPFQHNRGTLIRRKYRIEYVLDLARVKNQCEPLKQNVRTYSKAWQLKGVRKLKVGIAENWKWHVQTARHLALVLGVLAAEACYFGPECSQVLVRVAKTAGLGSTAPGTRDQIPAVG